MEIKKLPNREQVEEKIRQSTMELFKYFYRGKVRKAYKLFANLLEQHGDDKVQRGLETCISLKIYSLSYLVELLKKRSDNY